MNDPKSNFSGPVRPSPGIDLLIVNRGEKKKVHHTLVIVPLRQHLANHINLVLWLTMSSILRILLTVSEAKRMADVETSRG